ncbi:nitrilase-related carbon-nitrogen hydrolase [Mycolicibacterium bacteremicum]|uniref:nitrilase-related carbon-nitrogen hydrolase n=1 Tax=Mycolicibacterium bacteremicum TaxID=564198 RepID=UPI0026F0E530|nr:nitrilase-related carbon-nitrogen hydrolase [Mycolicibacterium bacteremicum]
MADRADTVRVAIAQLDVAARDVARNSARLSALVTEHADADLVVVPELALTGYQVDDLDELAAPPEQALAEIAAACARAGTAFVGGYLEPGPGRPYDAMAVIDAAGALVANYRKTHLFHAEAAAFATGDRLVVARLGDLAIGLMNCFDMEFPEVARTLADNGAQLLVVSSANMDPLFHDHLIAGQSRALENRLPLVYANRCGTEIGHQFCGGSRAVDPDGRVLAELDRDEGVLTVDVPLHSALGDFVQYRSLLRPELYSRR